MLLVLAACNEPAPTPEAKAKPEPAKKAAPELEPGPEPEPEPGPPVRQDGTIYGSSQLMGTSVSINVFLDAGKSTAKAGEAMQAALDEMARLEDLLSEWKPQSDLSQLNDAAGGEARPVGPDLLEVLLRSRTISKDSDGAFDVTFHGVGQLWSFKPGAQPPDRKEIAGHLPLVDWTAVEIDAEKKTVRLGKAGMKIGLGAIAKGYAVDRASEVLKSRGFNNHIVEAGGDTFASGTKGGQPWMVGVQDPDDRSNALGAIPTSNDAIVTSGDYMRFFDHEGKRYAHIIDPRTGWPIEQATSPKSVTLVAGNATDADGYCTAVTVMGPKKGMAFVESRKDLEAVIIDRDGNVMVSKGLIGVYQPR
jgi:thiamine biosynthesis lipoprotein